MDVDPELWAEANSEARRIIRSSFLGSIAANLSSYYQDGVVERKQHELAVGIYNRKVAEYNSRVQG